MAAQQPPAVPVAPLPYVFEYTYRRSLGPVLGRFFASLSAGRIEGVRTASGQVIVPPTEYDPTTGENLPAGPEFVEVGPGGVVQSWSWMAQPHANQPLNRPFAWALIKLDGASTAILHAVDAGSPGRMHTGMRVTVRWAAERTGSIRDIACFEPSNEGPVRRPSMPPEAVGAPLRLLKTPVRLEYTIAPGRALERYLSALTQRKITGGRCPACQKVYVPLRGACPTCAKIITEEVPVSDHGTVVSFCIVNVPYEGQTMKLPYVYASILLDGADLPLAHLIQDIPAEKVRMGLRVQAEWAEERRPTMETIRWFRPTGEPDAPFDSYKEHL